LSSVAKGTAFEDRVFEAVKGELEADRLGLSPRLAKPFKKKGYYSKDREADIIVDMSVEVWLPGADHWSLLWVCECKDYAGSVPVDDVEEFKSKLDQIAGANKKGVMAISGAMQAGALKYARASGIGVIRILPDNQVSYRIYQLTPSTAGKLFRLNPTEFYRALTQPDFVGTNRGFYAEFGDYIFGDFGSLLKSVIRDGSKSTS
jgi:hypothetical protein